MALKKPMHGQYTGLNKYKGKIRYTTYSYLPFTAIKYLKHLF